MESKKKKKSQESATNCEMCVYFDTDPETGEDYCSVNLDEDELYRFMQGGSFECPYFTPYDEYKIVRKQN